MTHQEACELLMPCKTAMAEAMTPVAQALVINKEIAKIANLVRKGKIDRKFIDDEILAEAESYGFYSDVGTGIIRIAISKALESSNGHDDYEGINYPTIVDFDEFVKGFIPPDYFIVGMLQRKFLYSMTGVPGGGKTAVALTIHQFMSATTDQCIGPYAIKRGRSLYFVGENPDDIRARLIASERDIVKDNSLFIVGVFDIEAMMGIVCRQVEDFGGVDLIFVDTSAVYNMQISENDNSDMGKHVQMLRNLTMLPGGPCVIVLCHPPKAVTDQENMVPRGGSSFIGAVDGNLTIMATGEDTCELHHTSKFRGPGFEPVTFKLQKVSSDRLLDSEGNRIITVRADPLSEDAEIAERKKTTERENKILQAMLDRGQMSVTAIAEAAGMVGLSGNPQKSTTHRILSRLGTFRPSLVRKGRGGWEITADGEKEAEKAQKER